MNLVCGFITMVIFLLEPLTKCVILLCPTNTKRLKESIATNSEDGFIFISVFYLDTIFLFLSLLCCFSADTMEKQKKTKTVMLPSSYHSDCVALIRCGYIIFQLCPLHTFSYNRCAALMRPLTHTHSLTLTYICTFTAAAQR